METIDQRIGTLSVSPIYGSRSLGFTPGYHAPTYPPYNPKQSDVKLGWAGDIRMTAFGKSVQLGNWFRNKGSVRVTPGWDQGLQIF
jgi:hypothetical protein